MKFLIVDDDAVSRELLARILGIDPQHQTTVAKSGTEGWRILDDPGRSFDVAFIDLTMPEPDGFELLRRIRASSFLKSLEVVLCTGSNDRATVVKAARLGARHYIVKPCTEDIVARKLHQIRGDPAQPRPRRESAVIR